MRADHPEVVFLAEAFTHRAMMRTLAKAGFSQSYTYFTWKQARWELTEYLTELATTDERHYFRPNLFVNTPGHPHRPAGRGRPGHLRQPPGAGSPRCRPSYGVYSGYEHFERTPVVPGSEEYLDSEKYEAKARALDGPLLPLIGRLNRIRRAEPALQVLDGLTFLETENDAIIAYAKQNRSSTVITAVSLDPDHEQEGVVIVPAELGLPPSFTATDLLSEQSWTWRLGRNYVRLVPHVDAAAHVLRIEV